jgi:hypothetical protein
MSENRMTTDTERGRALLAEMKKQAEGAVHNRALILLRKPEYDLLIDLALAADRRRQAEDEMRQREEKWTSEGWVEWRYREGVADKELRAALDNLLAHLAREGA